MLTGMVLPVLHGEITQLLTELQSSRLTIAAVNRLCVTRPELRGEIEAEMRRITDEQKQPPESTKKRGR